MSRVPRISHAERINVRYITIDLTREKKDMKEQDLDRAIIMANDGDLSSTSIDKRDAAKNTRKHCFARPVNPYFFITFSFKFHFARSLLSKTTVIRFKDLIGDLGNTGVERKMDSRLNGSGARIWYLRKNNELLRGVIDLVRSEFK